MLKCIGYIRTSTDRQELSLEAQEQKVRAMAAIKDAVLMEVIIDEGESGRDLDRPGAQRLMAMVKSRSVDMVIVAKLDRITRSVRDLAEIVDLFNRKKVAFVSVSETLDTSSANGRLFVNILGLIAQWEREIIAERTEDALQVRKRRGAPTGNAPYGYRVEGEPPRPDRKRGDELVSDASETAVLERAKTLRSGGMSLRKLADTLNAEGFLTRKGTPWRFQYVANILGEVER